MPNGSLGIRIMLLTLKTLVTTTLTLTVMSCSYLPKHSIGTAHTPVVNKPAFQDNSKTKVNDSIHLANNNSTHHSNYQLPTPQDHLANKSSLTNMTRLDDIDIYYFTSTLMMSKIYRVVQGRFIAVDNCLFFEHHHYDKVNLLTPFFDPQSTVKITPNENTITLNGTTVKLGEMISTSGNIKDESNSYALYDYENAKIVGNKDGNPCFLDNAIFMSGTVRQNS